MHPKLFPSPLLFILIIFVVLVHVPISLCDDERYGNCSQPFVCGSLGNIIYPFWGRDRPQFCGHPGFELDCQDDNITEIEIMSEKYRVLEITPDSQILKVARDDFWNNICPLRLVNTTLNFTIFNYASTVHNLTLYYNCTLKNIPSVPLFVQSSAFNCSVNKTTQYGFYVTGTTPADAFLWKCGDNVIVPVLQTAANALETNGTTLGATLDGGFELQWTVGSATCNQCLGSGGQCGYNSSTGQFNCFCRDQPYSKTCFTPGTNSGEVPCPIAFLISDPSYFSLIVSITQLAQLFCTWYTDLPSHVFLQMHSHFSRSPTFFLIVIIFSIFKSLPVSFSENDGRYTNCTRTFDCGNIQNIGYPFWGRNRPEYCGLPEFELRCEDGSPEMEIMSQQYHVLGINQIQEVLTLARMDFWNDTCPLQFANTTLNYTLFNYTRDNANLTLFYGCTSTIVINASNRFDCTVNGITSGSYFVIGPVPMDPNQNLTKCNISIQVPILQAAVYGLLDDPLNLEKALRGGFKVKYNATNDTLCMECVESGGHCGYDWTLLQPTCFCHDQPYPEACPTSGISGGVAAIIIAFLLFIIFRRRKQTIRETKSKDLSLLSTIPSLPSENITSFTSSKTDLEKASSYFGVPIFTNEELEEATDNFNPSKELGDGGFGTVYLGKLRDGRVVAVKRLYENNFKRVEQFMNEVEILTRLRHQNLVTLYGCSSRRSRELLLVYEFIPNGTVADHLHGNRAKAGSVTWPVRMSIAIETADALAYLHASDIIHRDVKSNNILLDNNFRVKVADFGLSRLFPTDVTHVSTAPQGTPGYVDPEYYQCYQITDKSDVYSFGVVLIELISSKQAVDVNRHRQEINLANMAISKIQNCALHELVDPCIGFESDFAVRRMTTLVAELAFRCLQQEREMRPSMEEVLEVLRGIEREDYKVVTAEVVDIPADDVGLLKSMPPPLSPDSVNDKWFSISSSTTPNIRSI
ncbi:hypothetical protein HHK36_031620 [Tetracentron sinense]|uniref:non-specific serine/threonine protein kinase n=1 Tax=Tetracentron sinense TaxID=13715 RepID=A0A834Y6L4_TETSI|nr:hypothetical protein HHK36_031620 [Tetracentron sinense]